MAEQTATTENTVLHKFAAVLVEKMKQISSQPVTLDFGSILPDFSLQTNRFPIPIPQKEYFVCRMAALSITQGLGQTAEASDHSHTIPLPEALDPIQPGDRVLIAWVEDDAVVIDKFVPAEAVEVKKNG